MSYLHWWFNHRKEKRFQNVDSAGVPIIDPVPGLGMILRWRRRKGEFAHTSKTAWPKKVIETQTFPKPPSQTQGLHITLINHLTFLIQINGVNIITDPVFSKCTGPYGRIGPKRAVKAGLEISELPKIDIILLTHNHYDHMDLPSLEKIAKAHDPLILTGINNGYYLGDISKKITELKWGDMHSFDNLRIHFTRAYHWSGRYVSDRNWALWGSFVIESEGKKIYFSGDTAFADHYQDAVDKFGGFDVSFLPIGAYKPREFMKPVHQDPEEAVRAHMILKSELSIGAHFGTFDLADEGIDEPIIDLKKALEKHQVDPKTFICLKNGENFAVKKFEK